MGPLIFEIFIKHYVSLSGSINLCKIIISEENQLYLQRPLINYEAKFLTGSNLISFYINTLSSILILKGKVVGICKTKTLVLQLALT